MVDQDCGLDSQNVITWADEYELWIDDEMFFRPQYNLSEFGSFWTAGIWDRSVDNQNWDWFGLNWGWNFDWLRKGI